ncbi:Protein of unknown function [Paenibacillus sophorae]|uniref:DUF3021 domain-containing protein n=1 Tax=Paenibacillus sophorae TaxID=1333845 RepID=A0A1H8TJ61_9BACL|nr:DUF3021 family protein [Paenibacillus sophorae]QWU16220.1 DUF3021 domain-containing protein [Paenibacillus sophorae]SEO90548.1 Protein of unknown function [Paenibacillus sophorae]
MKISEFVKGVIRNFLIIFAAIIIIITILRQIFYPDMVYDLKSIYILMIFSLLGALTGFILYSPNDISEKNMRVRIIIHFLALEMILISLGNVIGIVNSALHVIIMALQIALIYVIVRLLSWQGDKKEAQRINEKLKELKR